MPSKSTSSTSNRSRLRARPERDERFGFFRLGSARRADAEQAGERVARGSLQDAHAPTQRRRRDGERTERVTQVVLAVSERALAVLPRLAPSDRRETDEHALPFGKRAAMRRQHFLGQLRAQLERVLARRVVRDERHGADALEGTADR
jgi:hypothetical protein